MRKTQMSSAFHRRHFGKTSLHHILATSISSSALLSNVKSHAMEGSIYRVAVVGHTGRGDFGHGLDKMWQKVSNTKTVAISDSAGMEHAKRRIPGVEAFDDYREMLRSVKPDIVSIAPRHVDQHHAMCMEAIHNQVKGIYIENPSAKPRVKPMKSSLGAIKTVYVWQWHIAIAITLYSM